MAPSKEFFQNDAKRSLCVETVFLFDVPLDFEQSLGGAL